MLHDYYADNFDYLAIFFENNSSDYYFLEPQRVMYARKQIQIYAGRANQYLQRE